MSKRIIGYFAGVLLVICFVMMFAKDNALAASYSAEKDSSSGKFIVKDKETGEAIAKISVKTDRIESESVYVTSKNIFFTAHKTANVSGYSVDKYSLYRYSRDTKKTKYLKYLGYKFFYYDVALAHDGSLYINAGNERIGLTGGMNDRCVGYRYYLSTKKLQKITDEGVSDGYKDYILCYFKGFNMPSRFDIDIYNSKTKKTTSPIKNTVICQRKNQYIYFAKPDLGSNTYYGPNWHSYKHTVGRYDLLTGKTKKLATSLTANFIGKVTNKYIFYQLNEKYYRYTISTKKSEGITVEQYRESWNLT